jgi:hypothetical protein
VLAAAPGCQAAVNAKPTTEELGIDPDAQAWQRSGEGNGAIEIAFVRGTRGTDVSAGTAGDVHGTAATRDTGGTAGAGGEWVLMRVAGDPDRRVLVFDRHEWECFLDGARKGEFDDAAGDAAAGDTTAEAR